jgi:hypothetical protein
VPKPKEDHILFLPQPPYTIINNPHFHHNVSKSITSYMVRYLNHPQEESFIKAYTNYLPSPSLPPTFLLITSRNVLHGGMLEEELQQEQLRN